MTKAVVILKPRTPGEEAWSRLTEEQREVHRERIKAALSGKPMYTPVTIDGCTYFATSGGYCRTSDSGDYVPDAA